MRSETRRRLGVIALPGLSDADQEDAAERIAAIVSAHQFSEKPSVA